MNQQNIAGERTLAAYVVLVMCAGTRSTITYGRLGQLVETIPIAVGDRILDPIYKYCRNNQLPSRTVLNRSQGEMCRSRG